LGRIYSPIQHPKKDILERVAEHNSKFLSPKQQPSYDRKLTVTMLESQKNIIVKETSVTEEGSKKS